MTKKIEQVQIISQEQLAEGIFSMWIRTEAAKSAKPGQFLSMYTNDGTKLLPRPIRICEMLSQLDGVCYAERVTIDTPAHIKAAKKAMIKGVQNQIDKKGFSIIEVISPCPVQWGLSPNDAYKRIAEEVLPFYNLKVFKDVDKEVTA